MAQWLLYGANGYTGKLIAQKAVQIGMRPILGGRGASVRDLAKELNLPCRIFDLADAAATAAALHEVNLVLNCAGPFSATAEPMIMACLKQGSHYLDITGEITVFKHAHSQHETARQRGIVICPGVGFDVIPTDCIAAALKEAMPDATELTLGFDAGKSGMSQGTLKTVVETTAQGGKVRRNGEIVTVPLAYKVRKIDFGFGEKSATTLPWGDVETAWYSTNIGNIEVYAAMPRGQIAITKWSNWNLGLLRRQFVQRLLKYLIDKWVKGPDEKERATTTLAVWGEAKNARGDLCVARITTASGYQFTIDSALLVTGKLLRDPPAEGGYFTPSMLYGSRLVEELPGSGRLRISLSPSDGQQAEPVDQVLRRYK